MKTVTSPNLRYGDQVFSIVLKTPRRFARGGLVKAASKVREAGRYGDDMLVHMNKAEFEQIKKAWGQPTYNPKTGLPEYFSLGSLIPVGLSLLGGILGSKHGSNGVPAPPTDPNLTARLPQWTNQRTVVPHTNPSDYFTYGQTVNPHPGEWDFFKNNSLANIGPPPPPPSTNPGARPVMGGDRRFIGNPQGHYAARGGRVGFAGGGLADFNQQQAMQQTQMGPMGNLANAGAGQQMGAFQGMPPPRPAVPPTVNPAQWGVPPNFAHPQPMPPMMGAPGVGGQLPPSSPNMPPQRPPMPMPNPQMGALAAPPPGGPMTPGFGGGILGSAMKGLAGRAGGAGSMPGSSMALQRPQGPTGGPALGGMGGSYARPQAGQWGWNQGAQPGMRAFAGGGPASGPGTGRSDEIPAKLSDGEYVMDAETVSLLGDGSTNAGASKLDAMRRAIRSHKGPALAKGKFTPKAKLPWDYLNDMAARDDMNRNLRKGIK